MRHATILVAILAFTPLTTATAQVPIRRGERVRVTRLPICPPTSTICVGPPQQYVGTFVAWEADSLIMDSNGNALALALDSVTRLEVSRGQKSYAVEGAIIGLLLGGGVGAVIGYTNYEECVPQGFLSCLGDFGRGFDTRAGAVIGGLGGVVLGAFAGASNKTDRWPEMSPDRLRVSLGPQRDGGFGLGASVRF